MSRSDSESPAFPPENLRARREAAGLSLRALSRRSGYSTAYLSRVETAQRSVTPAVTRLYSALDPAQDGSSSKQTRTVPPRSAGTAATAMTAPRLDLEVTWFGSEVRRLRTAAGKSLDALGGEVYLSRAYLGKIEQGDARGSYQLAMCLDTALDAQGGLTRLFLEECARVGPTAPDTDILARGGPEPGTGRRLDHAELAHTAAARLRELRIRSHQAGPYSVIHELGDGIVRLSHATGGLVRSARSSVWPVTLQYAELLGWAAQEMGQDRIARRWTGVVADWAKELGDVEALSYTLIRQSQQARRSGDVTAAVELARRAGAVAGISFRMAQFAAQRETQACALAQDERAFRRNLDRYRSLVADASTSAPEATLWGPSPDPSFEHSRLFEATCLVDLADFRAAAPLFEEGMRGLVPGRTGHARLALRQAIACAQIGEFDRACQIMFRFLPTVARQGSASLRGDLKHLIRVLNRQRRSPAVSALLPDLAAVARVGGRLRPGAPPPIPTTFQD